MRNKNIILAKEMEFVTIKIFDNAFEAHILKGKLRSEGIDSFLFDENTVSVYPLYNLTVGGIKLKVKTEDFEKVKEIMNSSLNIPITDDDEHIIKCPNCKSTAVYSGFKSVKNLKGVLATIVSLLFMVFPFYYETVYRCKECDTEFEIKK